MTRTIISAPCIGLPVFNRRTSIPFLNSVQNEKVASCLDSVKISSKATSLAWCWIQLDTVEPHLGSICCHDVQLADAELLHFNTVSIREPVAQVARKVKRLTAERYATTLQDYYLLSLQLLESSEGTSLRGARWKNMCSLVQTLVLAPGVFFSSFLLLTANLPLPQNGIKILLSCYRS